MIKRRRSSYARTKGKRPMRKMRRVARRSSRRKRVSGRSFRNNRLNTTFTNFGFPRSKVVKMKFFNCQNVPWPGGVNYTNVITTNGIVRMNSVYDANYAAGGEFNHTAAGYKLYSTLYNNYCVIGSKVTYTLRQSNSYFYSTSSPSYIGSPMIRWGVKLDDDADTSYYTGSNYWTNFASDPHCRYKSYDFRLDGGAKQVSKITMRYAPKKWYGIKDVADNVSTVGAAMGANPLKVVYAIPWWGIADVTNTISQSAYFSLDIVVSFIVLLSNPKDIANLATANALVQG